MLNSNLSRKEKIPQTSQNPRNVLFIPDMRIARR